MIYSIAAMGAHAQESNLFKRHAIGLRVGFEAFDWIYVHPLKAHKDFGCSYHTALGKVPMEARLFVGEWEESARYNVFLLSGYTTDRTRMLVFDVLGGVTFGFGLPKSDYVTSVMPAAKLGLHLRLFRGAPALLGVETLLFYYRYWTPQKYEPAIATDPSCSLRVSLIFEL